MKTEDKTFYVKTKLKSYENSQKSVHLNFLKFGWYLNEIR